MSVTTRVAVALIGSQVAFAAAIGLGGVIGLKPAVAYASGDHSVPTWLILPPCQYEDGNTDGQPCAWTDPDTGDLYIVASDNYRGTCWTPLPHGDVVQRVCGEPDAIGPVTP